MFQLKGYQPNYLLNSTINTNNENILNSTINNTNENILNNNINNNLLFDDDIKNNITNKILKTCFD